MNLFQSLLLPNKNEDVSKAVYYLVAELVEGCI